MNLLIPASMNFTGSHGQNDTTHWQPRPERVQLSLTGVGKTHCETMTSSSVETVVVLHAQNRVKCIADLRRALATK